jgi:hypothetical protein
MVFISMTIAQAQAEFLKQGGLNGGGMLREDVAELSELEKELSNYVTTFLTTASDNLNKTNSVTTGELDRSLSFELVPNKGGYLINFKALEYFKFVDKGVRGAGSSRKNNTSPYSFKYITPSKSHVTAIEKWIIRNRLTATRRDVNKYGRTKRESKAIDPAKGRKQLAYIIAKSIKRDGLYETGFWSDAFDQTFKDFGVKMSAALGRSITVNLEKMKEDLANFKGRRPGQGTQITTR